MVFSLSPERAMIVAMARMIALRDGLSPACNRMDSRPDKPLKSADAKLQG